MRTNPTATGNLSGLTITKRKKKTIPPMTAPMPLIASQSPTRRSPGLPARARRFSVRSENDVLVTRDMVPDRRWRERTQRALDERRLKLEFLEVLGLHGPELGQACLDRVDRRTAGEADDDEQDAAGRNSRDDDGEKHR